MKILVIGGTKYFGIHMIEDLLGKGHEVTIATRGKTKDRFGDRVQRIIMDREKPESVKKALSGRKFDVVIDKIAYCSNDIKAVLDVISCDMYIHTSTGSVYYDIEKSVWSEKDFDPYKTPLVWCSSTDFHFGEIKRQAECALFQAYKDIPAIAVRLPLVMGKDDYTRRLYFYVEKILKSVPMHVDNPDSQISFIRSDEAWTKKNCRSMHIPSFIRLCMELKQRKSVFSSFVTSDSSFNSIIANCCPNINK